MTKFAVYEARPVKGGKFNRVSEFFATAEEAIETMNEWYPRCTKVMAKNGKELKVIKYHENY